MAPNISGNEAGPPSSQFGSEAKLTKTNIFFNLSVFYTSDDVLGGNETSRVLVSLLKDFLTRKGFSLDDIVQHLMIFCHGHQDRDIQGRSFIHAVLNLIQDSQRALHKALDGPTTVKHVQGLLRLLWKFSGTFNDIFSEICKPIKGFVDKRPGKRDNYDRLKYLLRYGHALDVTPGPEEKPVRFIDAPLAYGESPLMLASRNRCPDAVLLLLRHGADVNTTWLYFRSSLEVLLFAPNQVFISEEDLSKIVLCLHYHLRAVARVDLGRLEGLTKEGYTELLPEWRSYIPESYWRSPCTLTQLSRCALRQTLNRKRLLPNVIQQLPLPTLMKSYLDLRLP